MDTDTKEIITSGVGELYIGGLGVAIGYLNQPELTKEKFINTAFGRLYKTGDLVKKVNNEYHFVGRSDNQIKINGIRIELEEIENLALNTGYVGNACAIYDKILTLYFTKALEYTKYTELEIINILKEKFSNSLQSCNTKEISLYEFIHSYT